MSFTIYKQLPLKNKKLIEIAPEILQEYQNYIKKPSKAKRIYVYRDKLGHFVKKDFAGLKKRYSLPIYREIKTGKYEKKAIGTPKDFIKIYKNKFKEIPKKELEYDFKRLLRYEKHFIDFPKIKKLSSSDYPVANEVFPRQYKTIMKAKFENENGEKIIKYLTVWHDKILSKKSLSKKLKEIVKEDENEHYEALELVSSSPKIGLRSQKIRITKHPKRKKSLRR